MLIPFDEIIRKHQLKPNGILHLGAHLAEESESYSSAGIRHVIWLEANPELVTSLKESVGKIEGNEVIELVVGDVDGKELEFNIGAEDQTSSLLKVADLQKFQGDDVDVVKKLKVKTTRLDTFLHSRNIDVAGYDFLNIDLQGAEMMALKGLGREIEKVKAIYTEVNLGNLYENCPKLFDLDKFLGEKGFIRVEVALTPWQWGDALYLKKDFSVFTLYRKLAEARALQAGSFFQSRAQLGLKWCRTFFKRAAYKMKLLLKRK